MRVVEESSNFDRDVINNVMPTLERLSIKIDKDLKAEAPRDTGNLAATTYSHLDRYTGKIRAGATANYALAVEVGHYESGDGTDVPPNRFLLRALMRNAGEVK